MFKITREKLTKENQLYIFISLVAELTSENTDISTPHLMIVHRIKASPCVYIRQKYFQETRSILQ